MIQRNSDDSYGYLAHLNLDVNLTCEPYMSAANASEAETRMPMLSTDSATPVFPKAGVFL